MQNYFRTQNFSTMISTKNSHKLFHYYHYQQIDYREDTMSDTSETKNKI